MLTLAAKLAYLLRRRPGPDGELPSNRALSTAIQNLPGHTRGGSVGALSKLRRGEDDNPTVATLTALSAVLDAPSAFLLPGWDDFGALSALERNHQALDIVRHLDGLPPADLDALLEQIQDRREQLGLDRNTPAEEIETEPDSGEVNRRYRRRRSMEEAAKYAADSLEGL
ncbi:hypothetical protein [Streptomyces sp. H27-C3]|uniref:hypothetical protein n=1 Tax=Streptomyces sp. H27-C3 TaxID=3046305 RepID=UPI0024B98F62|nr:hypothetical protein [Streptomyces sp. H27-C3]MDJ0463098.1 hypothetical protein [Streptomyces sp. H27-C3]